MYRIVRERIDVPELQAALASPACGGAVTFVGIVRERADDGRLVDGLSYEAFESMALAVFEEIAAEAARRFEGARVAIAHRIGDCNVGDVAVAVVAASEHRGAAFDACEYAIDELKARAPIWKKERYADGSAVWRENACE